MAQPPALRWAGLGILILTAIAGIFMTCLASYGVDKGTLKLALSGLAVAVFVAGVSLAIVGTVLSRRHKKQPPPTNT